MKKRILLLVIFSIIVIATISVLLLNIIIQHSGDGSYNGTIDVYFYHDTTLEQISNISKIENITIVSLKNVTLGQDKYIKVVYEIEDKEKAIDTKHELEKYNEIYEIEIFDDQ